MLTGGEIFLREDLFDIASMAKRKRFALFLFTNATLISPSVAERVGCLFVPFADYRVT